LIEMTKLKTLLILLSLFWLTACPAPEFNHVIVNESDMVLEVEYEFFLPSVKHDSSQLTAPAKMTLGEYDGEDAGKNWRELVAQKDYELEIRKEAAKWSGSQASEKHIEDVWKYRLKLMPGEVLRLFHSSHINFDVKNLKKIILTSDKGRLEIEGDGFEQFAPYSWGGFFSRRSDYRIVFR